MKTVKKFMIWFLLALIFCVTLIPIIWVFLSSFKSKKELMTKPWGMPEKFLFSNYSSAWEKADFAALTKNSVMITALSLLLMLVFATMLAFAISRYRGKLSQMSLIYLLAGQTISAGMIIFPIVIVLRKLGFGDSHAGLILTYAAGGLPFAVFVLQGFFAGIPYELYEAAEIDGASEFRIFINVAIPLAKPALATVLLYQFMWVWNEFVLAFTIVSRPEKRTIIAGLYSVVNGYLNTDYVTAFAGAMIVCVPIIIIYLIFQKYLIQGLIAGAVKG